MKLISDKELYEFAKKKVESKREFIIHVGIYFIFSVISITLLLINGFKPQYIVPVLGWGVGVIFHALSLNFNFSFNLENEIQNEIKKLRDN
ncbi:2TM domain-containing protein [Alkaliphilus sp. B6464]|uniref:2TM domain-containing protein n=1 Tax=Alkaliphilus sp. B6464 TaxID=2731219 RepID=UPI001BAC4E93|nr:2TM domain-containing protein [Alkaliphilus sp. B6464]QUH19264.1 2TM domain-containing protein [Alkaliphilus sp. B6464]